MLRPVTVTFVIHGTRVRCLEDFWTAVGEAVNGPGGYFGRNLDAFNDCLRGGFGQPEDDDYVIEWGNHDVSQRHLGYRETVRQLELRLGRGNPSNRALVQADLDEARAGRGATVYDWLLEIMEVQIPDRYLLTSRLSS